MKYEYITFFLKPSLDKNPIVYYSTNLDSGVRRVMFYDRFIEFLNNNFVMKNSDLLLKDLNSHFVIYLDSDGNHTSRTIVEVTELENKLNNNKYNIEDLLKLNTKNEKDSIINVLYKNIKQRIKNINFTNKGGLLWIFLNMEKS